MEFSSFSQLLLSLSYSFFTLSPHPSSCRNCEPTCCSSSTPPKLSPLEVFASFIQSLFPSHTLLLSWILSPLVLGQCITACGVPWPVLGLYYYLSDLQRTGSVSPGQQFCIREEDHGAGDSGKGERGSLWTLQPNASQCRKLYIYLAHCQVSFSRFLFLAHSGCGSFSQSF